MYNLTENQKSVLIWIVEQIRSGNLEEEFYFYETADGKTHIHGRGAKVREVPLMSPGTMKALMTSNLVIYDDRELSGTPRNHVTLLGNAYLAVDSEFGKKIDETNLPLLNSVFGKPNTSYMFDIFVLMPFLAGLKPIYDDHIKQVAKQLNLTVARADDFFSQNSIIEEIWSAISQASILIADCTGRNPNVFYEMGIAHALSKPVIVITQNSDDVPFDIRHRRYIHYEYTPPGMKKFETDLYKTISETLRDLNTDIKPL